MVNFQVLDYKTAEKSYRLTVGGTWVISPEHHRNMKVDSWPEPVSDDLPITQNTLATTQNTLATTYQCFRKHPQNLSKGMGMGKNCLIFRWCQNDLVCGLMELLFRIQGNPVQWHNEKQRQIFYLQHEICIFQCNFSGIFSKCVHDLAHGCLLPHSNGSY